YPRTSASATGASTNASGLRKYAATTRTTAFAAQEPRANAEEIRPVTRARDMVRGFAACRGPSAHRLNEWPALRAAMTAITNKRSVQGLGRPFEARSRKARGHA